MIGDELHVPHANDNDNDVDNDVDNAADERAVVRFPAGRPELTYAQRGNLVLPLRFARLMPGWQLLRPRAEATLTSPATADTAARAARRPAPRRRPTPAAARRIDPRTRWSAAARRAPDTP